MADKRWKWLTVAPLFSALKAWVGRLVGEPDEVADEVPIEMNGEPQHH